MMKGIAPLMILLTICFALPAAATAADPVGSVTFVKGRVDVTRPGQPAEPLLNGADIYVGDIIRTKSRAKAELTFVDDSIIRIAPKSRLEVTEYLFERQERRSTFNLFRGKIQSLVKQVAGFSFGRQKRNRFEVHTPTAVCGVRGTVFFTWFLNGESGAAVQEGGTYIYPGNQPGFAQNLGAGQAAVVYSAEEPPLVRPATDVEMQQHIDDTNPEAEGGDDQGYVDPGSLPSGDDTGLAGPSYNPDIAQNYNPYVPPEIAGENVTGTVDLGFLNNGAISGLFLGSDTFGSVSLTGKVTAVPPSAHYGDLHGTIADGAFAGYIGGAAGSWDAVFNTLTVTHGAAGLFYGYVQSGQNLTDGTKLSATGEAYRYLNLGKAKQDLTTIEDLAVQSLPIPLMSTTRHGTAEARGMKLKDGRLAAVYGAAFDQPFDPPENSPFYQVYGEYGPNYFMLGNLKVITWRSGHVAIEGNDALLYMDPLYLGDVFPYYRGVLDDGGEVPVLQTAGVGTYVLDPLSHYGFVSSVLKRKTSDGVLEDSPITGIFGGIDSLWDTPVDGGPGTPAEVRSIGVYAGGGFDQLSTGTDRIVSELAARCIWSTEVSSMNALNGSMTAYDGGSYVAMVGGAHNNDKISGSLAGIYVAPDRSAGLFWGGLSGNDFLTEPGSLNASFYPMFLLNGVVEGRAKMTGNVGFSPAALNSRDGPLEIAAVNFSYDGFFDHSGGVVYEINGGSPENTSKYLTLGTDKQFGTWKTELYGSYYNPVGRWESYLQDMSSDLIHRWLTVSGYEWTSGGKLKADAAGAWVNITDAVTGIMAGTAEGTHHQEFTGGGYWEAIAGGVLMDTATFLSYADSKPGVLKAMNVPNIEVGKATLQTSGEDLFDVTMQDTRFFSYRSKDPPTIWASGAVTGYNPAGSENEGATVIVSGSSSSANLSADFTLNNWNGSKWDARIEGSGTIFKYRNHSIQFKGAAAGRVNNLYDFRGTAAGVAGR